MPQLSGLSLARAMQALRPGVPVLLVSAAADLPQGEEAYADTGVRECLPKPLDTNALAEAVWRVLHDDAS
jgi:FixJ family two-component response regulator